MSQEFKIGDRVQWGGVTGSVVGLGGGVTANVKWDNGADTSPPLEKLTVVEQTDPLVLRARELIAEEAETTQLDDLYIDLIRKGVKDDRWYMRAVLRALKDGPDV